MKTQSSNIAIVNCGMGNLHSVAAAVRRIAPAAAVCLTDKPSDLQQADKIIFPGDGHFDACIKEIDARGLRECLLWVASSKPFLGICVGMQVLFESSEEGSAQGLGIFSARIARLPSSDSESPPRKIPHIGWNTTHHQTNASANESPAAHAWTQAVAEGERFYYVHSYYAPLGDWTLMRATYGVEFSAVIAKDSLWATQFHPEKSGQHGIALLARFINGVDEVNASNTNGGE